MNPFNPWPKFHCVYHSGTETQRLKERAKALGFQLVGVAPAGPFPEAVFYPQWLAEGYAGEMRYLEHQAATRLDLQKILPGARSVVVCAVNYNTAHPTTRFNPLRAWISRYAWGEDYHETLQSKLKALAAWMEETAGGRAKTYVDTGPLLERVYAKYAGIGWFGKNTCILNEKLGSWLFLGCIVTDLALAYDMPVPDRCGTCRRCIDACPTGAILEPYVLDSRKCIAYLTIELKGEIPESHRDAAGHHLFGCDICQDVCPWNRKSPKTLEAAFQPKPGLFWPEIDTLLDMNEDEWRDLIRGTAMKRATIRGLVRNLMVVAGNSGLSRFRAKVEKFLSHPEASVRSHAAWALKKLAQ